MGPQEIKNSFIKDAKKIHGNTYEYGKVKYDLNELEVTIICKVHGKFKQKVGIHLQGQGCIKCFYKHIPSMNEWIEKAKEIHGDRYNYSENKIIIICKIHGEFKQEANSHLQGFGCPRCIKSGCLRCAKNGYPQKSIIWLTSIMEKENIYIQHIENGDSYKIPGTIYKADGYCKGNNTIYQFYGSIFHGDPRTCNPEDYNFLDQNYGDLNKQTLKKEQDILSLGYNLVVIWEYDFDQI